MLKVNNKDTRTTPGVVMVLLLTLTYFTLCSSLSIANFEQLNVGWEEACGALLIFNPFMHNDEKRSKMLCGVITAIF